MTTRRSFLSSIVASASAVCVPWVRRSPRLADGWTGIVSSIEGSEFRDGVLSVHVNCCVYERGRFVKMVRRTGTARIVVGGPAVPALG